VRRGSGSGSSGSPRAWPGIEHGEGSYRSAEQYDPSPGRGQRALAPRQGREPRPAAAAAAAAAAAEAAAAETEAAAAVGRGGGARAAAARDPARGGAVRGAGSWWCESPKPSTSPQSVFSLRAQRGAGAAETRGASLFADEDAAPGDARGGSGGRRAEQRAGAVAPGACSAAESPNGGGGAERGAGPAGVAAAAAAHLGDSANHGGARGGSSWGGDRGAGAPAAQELVLAGLRARHAAAEAQIGALQARAAALQAVVDGAPRAGDHGPASVSEEPAAEHAAAAPPPPPPQRGVARAAALRAVRDTLVPRPAR